MKIRSKDKRSILLNDWNRDGCFSVSKNTGNLFDVTPSSRTQEPPYRLGNRVDRLTSAPVSHPPPPWFHSVQSVTGRNGSGREVIHEGVTSELHKPKVLTYRGQTTIGTYYPS